MEYPFKDLMPLDEVLEREGYYKDWTHLDPEVFYSLTQISEYIKTKGYGVDVRLLIAQLAEHFGLKTTQVVDLANLLQQKFTNLEGVTQSFTNNINSLVAQMEADKDAVIANATVDSEVILARGGKPTLGARIDDVTAQLADIGINVKSLGLGNNVNQDDGALLQTIFDNASEGDEIFVPYKTTLYFHTGVSVKKSLRFQCHGEIKIAASNIVAFTFPGKSNVRTDFTENQDWYIRKINGNSGERTQIGFKMQSNQFSRFKVDHAYDLKHVVLFEAYLSADGFRYTIAGENIWELVRWRNCDVIVHFKGGTGWGDLAPFMEGNQFINGFMSGSLHGIYVDNFVKAGGMLITCGIDNLEVAGSMDFVNKCDTTKYTIGNLILTRFMRLPNCEFRRNDMVMSPNFGTFLNGDLKVNGSIETYDLADDDITKTGGVLLSQNGNADFTSNNPYPFIDFRTERSKDYDARISLSNKKDVRFSVGGSGTIADGMDIRNNGTRIKPSGKASMPQGSTQITINFTVGMADTNYSISITPNWLTTFRVVNRSTSGFVIEVGTPAPANATIDYNVFLNS